MSFNSAEQNTPCSPSIPKLNLSLINSPKDNSHYDYYTNADSDHEESFFSENQESTIPRNSIKRIPSNICSSPDETNTPHQQHDLLLDGTLPPLSQAINKIKELYQKYENSTYMFQKTHNYICFQLPTILENMRVLHEERQQRTEEMTFEHEHFIQHFMNTNQYFYCHATETFFKYDGLHYSIILEDDVIYHILSTISKERQLMSWKQRTKVSILKRIKEISIMKSIPESETIQLVYNSLIPSIFSSKAEAKYFLCVLGDILFRKKDNNELMHFINTEAKHFIRELSNLCVFFFGCNLMGSLKVKYYEHNYEYSRLVPINKQIKEQIWMPILKSMGLNILVVACHYSTRYESSDKYLNYYCNDSRLINYILFLKSRTPELIVRNEFISKYLQKCDPETGKQLSWKNMQYLWKLYLENENLPNIMFQQSLKNILSSIDFLEYNSVDDVFMNMTSHYLPSIQHFLSFWKDSISIQEDNSNEYEIEELCTLYRKWCSSKKVSYHYSILTDTKMADYIRFYFPEIEMEQNKYVYNIRCSLWDKQLDIQTAMQQYIQHLFTNREYDVQSTLSIEPCKPMSEDISLNWAEHSNTTSKDDMLIIHSNVSIGETQSQSPQIEFSIYSAYSWYCKFYGHTNVSSNHLDVVTGEENHLLVSKSYFEKYLMEHINC